MPDIREEFEDRFPVPEGIEWRNTDYFPMQTENVHVYVALAGAAARYSAMWSAWKASRAALKVKLPDVPDFGISAEESLDMEPEVYESLEAIHCAEVAMLNRCKRALQQAGIEVAK